MRRYCGVIYKQARETAGLTQEQASYLLPIPVRTLSSYENGSLVPSGELVCRMIKVYESKWLWYLHLKNNDPVGKEFLPDIEFTDLAKSVLRLQKEVSDLDSINRDMIDIACDGKVCSHEEPRWRNITKEIYEMAGAALAVIFYR